jgi:hypothetical protein
MFGAVERNCSMAGYGFIKIVLIIFTEKATDLSTWMFPKRVKRYNVIILKGKDPKIICKPPGNAS